jgi:hypothetical protein
MARREMLKTVFTKGRLVFDAPLLWNIEETCRAVVGVALQPCPSAVLESDELDVGQADAQASELDRCTFYSAVNSEPGPGPAAATAGRI